jgi:hypothetical protein
VTAGCFKLTTGCCVECTHPFSSTPSTITIRVTQPFPATIDPEILPCPYLFSTQPPKNLHVYTQLLPWQPFAPRDLAKEKWKPQEVEKGLAGLEFTWGVWHAGRMARSFRYGNESTDDLLVSIFLWLSWKEVRVVEHSVLWGHWQLSVTIQPLTEMSTKSISWGVKTAGA